MNALESALWKTGQPAVVQIAQFGLAVHVGLVEGLEGLQVGVCIVGVQDGQRQSFVVIIIAADASKGF